MGRNRLAGMEVRILETGPDGADADLVALPLFEDGSLPGPLGSLPGAPDARADQDARILLRSTEGDRFAVIGAGPAGSFDAERARIFAAAAVAMLGEVRGSHLALVVPDGEGIPDAGTLAPALVEGAILASFRFDGFRDAKSDDDRPSLERIDLLTTATGLEQSVRFATASAEAANRARELQSLPANRATPDFLAERALELAGEYESIEVEVLDRAAIEAAGMGGLAAVSSGGREVEPRLITIRYRGRGEGEVLGLVGKSVTFDSGGISIKPSAGMHEMKMDMSGGAAVLEAVGCLAELGVGIDVIAVLPATENLPSGTALKPGDVITQLNGKTVEVTNTDAEGRLILADALVHCARQGADRLVDVATLTGAVLIGLGSTYAALISDDEALAGAIEAAGERTGEIVWRLPLHEEYFELTKGEITDLVNASAERKAGTIYAGSFLEQFTEGKPWAHLDIAGVAWGTGRAYWGKGPTGFGTRALVELAASMAGERD